MFQTQDVLIPARFICFILQFLLTLDIAFGWEDYVDATKVTDEGHKIKLKLKKLFVFLGFFYACELAEFIILITGYTLFSNFLSIVQIFLHSVSVLLLDWFVRDVWEVDQIISPFILGAVIPIVLEIIDLIIICSSNRKVTKIH